MGTSLFYQRLFQWIRPRFFLVGLVLTFLLLSLAGRSMAQRNIYSNFDRFHPFIEASTLFYPTASQLRAIAEAALHHQKDDEIAVIVGGDSVFNGVGQSASDLWTHHLQRLLGEPYRVINFAFRGAAIQEGAAIAAQSLMKEGYRKVIYVADIAPGSFGRPGGSSVYHYFLWDALYKGLIPADRPRDEAIRQMSPPVELQVRYWLDSVFYFNDLWTAIAYRWVFTVWNAIVAGMAPDAPWTWPRIRYSDPEGPLPPVSQRYPAANDAIEMKLLRGYCRTLFQAQGDERVPRAARWRTFKQQAQASFPDSFKLNTLLVVMHRSAYYVKQLSADQQACWQRAVKTTVRVLRRMKYYAIEVGKPFTPEDYADGVHLAPSGGIKLAESVALQVRAIAQAAGYVATESAPESS